MAAEGCEQDEERQARGEERGTRPVEGVRDAAVGEPQAGRDDGRRHQPDREVDEERPAPRQVLDEQAADDGADGAGDGEDHPLVPQPASELPSRDDVRDRRHGDGAETAAPEALEEPSRQQLVHRLRRPAGHRTDEEHADRDQQHASPAVEVAELPVQRHRGDHRERIGAHHPRGPREAADVVGDGGQGGGDDGAVDRAHHLPELEADEDHERLAERQRPRATC